MLQVRRGRHGRLPNNSRQPHRCLDACPVPKQKRIVNIFRIQSSGNLGKAPPPQSFALQLPSQLPPLISPINSTALTHSLNSPSPSPPPPPPSPSPLLSIRQCSRHKIPPLNHLPLHRLHDPSPLLPRHYPHRTQPAETVAWFVFSGFVRKLGCVPGFVGGVGSWVRGVGWCVGGGAGG